MNFDSIFEEAFKDSGLNNVVYLYRYKEEREHLYPNAGVKSFTDLIEHKKWLKKESEKKARKAHNERVMKEYTQTKGNSA